MKKRKILYLFPLAALILSGCTFEEGLAMAKDWSNEKVVGPVKTLIDKLLGKEEPKKEEQKEEQKPSGGEQGGQEGEGEGEGEGGGGEQHQGGGAIDTYGTEHEGTEADPLTGNDAMTIALQLAEDEVPEESFYIKDEVSELMEDFNPSFGNYTFKFESGFLCYRLKYGPNQQKFTSEKDLEVGDTVTVYAQIQNYLGDTPETKGGYVVKVEKPAIDAELLDLELSGNPKTAYLAGEAYTNEGLSAIASYDNGEEVDVTMQADWSFSKATAEMGDDEVVITASFGGLEASMTVAVTVQDSSAPEHEGTEADPYTGADAMIVGNKLEAGAATEGSFYIKGVVQSFEENFNPTYGNFSFKIDGGFIGWRLKNGPSFTAFTSADDLEIGDTVTMYAQIQNYSGKPETKGGYIVSIEKPAVAVESVEMSESHLDLEVGQQALLSATVLPAKASQEVSWSIQQDSEVVAYEDGKVVALAAGEATVVATSVADPKVSGLCSVTVTEATKELTGVTLSGTAKTEYVEGDSYSAEGLTLTANYSDQSSEDVTALATFEFSKETAEVGDDEITITATYNNLQDSMNVAVTVAEKKGTQDKPYSVSEAYALFEELSDGQNTAEFYVEGYIDSDPAPTISGGRGRFYLTDGVCATHMYVYNANNTENTNALTIDEIPVGAKALVRGAIKNYQGGFQICYVSGTAQCQLVKAVEAPVITAVGAVTGPSEVAVNGTIDPNNVTVAVTYSGVVEATVKATSVTGDFSAAGEATADVTIAGWNETLHFTVTVVSGTVLTEQEVYKLDGTVTGGTNGYATESEIEQGGINWLVMGNTTMAPWRIGGKSITNENRNITSVDAVSTYDITKVILSTGAASSCTVNSITLKVGSTKGGSDISSIEKTSGLVNANVEFERPENADWSGRYFTLIINITVSGSSNKFVEVKSVSFLAMK